MGKMDNMMETCLIRVQELGFRLLCFSFGVACNVSGRKIEL